MKIAADADRAPTGRTTRVGACGDQCDPVAGQGDATTGTARRHRFEPAGTVKLPGPGIDADVAAANNAVRGQDRCGGLPDVAGRAHGDLAADGTVGPDRTALKDAARGNANDAAVGVDGPGVREEVGGDLDAATASTASDDAAAGVGNDIAGGLQDDRPVLARDRHGRADRTTLADGGAVDADVSAHDAADIDRLIGAGGQLDLHVGTLAVDQDDAVAGGEHHGTIGRGDDAMVLDGRCHQVDAATGGGLERAIVADGTGAGLARERQPARQEIGVGQVERGCDEPGDVDRRPRAEGDTVGVDQEHPTIRGERAEDQTGIAADDAIEHLAFSRQLLEVGVLAKSDRERRILDDRTR